jgi:hypothetical protein
MYSTQVFVYTQRQIVILLSGNSPRSYMPQYAKPLTLHKGVDNQIQFQFLNQEQKPVNITGKEISCRILNATGVTVLIRKALTIQLGATGIAALMLNPGELEEIEAQKCYYTLEIPVGTFDYPVFVDQNAGGRGDMNIVNSILPSFVPSNEITIPTGQAYPNPDWYSSDGSYVPDSNSVAYYTSVYTTSNNPTLTLQATYTDFYGNVLIEGSTIGNTDWYPISTIYSYTDETDTFHYNVNGYHPFIRVGFVSNAGAVTNILAR